MLSRAIFLFILILPSFAKANVWTCVTGANLSGDPSYYWAQGRDAWTGTGTIECTSGRRMLRLGTNVRYEGQDPGIGASANSKLSFESLPVVTRDPGSLAQSELPVSQDGNPSVWISNDSPISLSFYIFGDQLERFASSTRTGTLSIFVEPAK